MKSTAATSSGWSTPDAPDFTGGDRHLGFALDALDDLDQARNVDALRAPHCRSACRFWPWPPEELCEFLGRVPRHRRRRESFRRDRGFRCRHTMRIDIRMLAGKFDTGRSFALVALGVGAEPGAVPRPSNRIRWRCRERGTPRQARSRSRHASRRRSRNRFGSRAYRARAAACRRGFCRRRPASLPCRDAWSLRTACTRGSKAVR